MNIQNHMFTTVLVGITALLILVSPLTGIENKKIFQLNGTSMTPTILPGEYVRCESFNTSLREGDIIAYNEQSINYTVIHRISKVIEPGKFRTKGDNNKFPDSYIVDKEEIICKID